MARYPRAFQWLLADGLYAQSPFINFLLAHEKQALVVLKDARRDLYQDACGLLGGSAPSGTVSVAPLPLVGRVGSQQWAPLNAPLRVIRSRET